MMVEITEFLRRLLGKIPVPVGSNKIQVVFEISDGGISVEKVVGDTIYYRQPRGKSLLTWTPTSTGNPTYLVNRVDELKTKKRKGFNSKLVSTGGSVRIQVRRMSR